MIEIRCVHSLEEAALWREAMDALNLASARPDPFSTYEFYAHHLRRAPPRPLQLWLLLALEAGQLVGYAALRRTPQRLLGWRWHKLDWLTAHDTDRPHLVAPPDRIAAVAAAMYDHLLDRAAEWDLLEFQQQEEHSPLTPPALTPSHRVRQWPNLANGTIPIRWDRLPDYFTALSPKARSNIGRAARRLLAAGDVEALSSSDPGALKPLFALYRCIEPQSWKTGAHANTGRDAGSVEYWEHLMDGSQPMRIWIQVVLLDGAPVSGLICGSFDRTLYALQIVHDERLARLSPGSAALLLGLRHAIEGGFAAFDLLRGSGYYKARWLARMSDTHSLQIYRAGSPVFWRRAMGDVLRRVLAPLRPRLAPMFNPMRRRLAAMDDSPAYFLWASRARAIHDRLVAEVRARPGEFLTSRRLREALPLQTRGG